MYCILKCNGDSDKVLSNFSVSDIGEEIYNHRISGCRIAWRNKTKLFQQKWISSFYFDIL